MVAEKYLVRHLMSIQQALKEGELDDAADGYRKCRWLPGTENAANGSGCPVPLFRLGSPIEAPRKVRIDLVPLSRLPKSGCFPPGSQRPLKRVTWKE